MIIDDILEASEELIMNRVYIIGGDQTDFERNWHKEGKNFVGMLREVVVDTLSRTGLSFKNISDLNRENRIAAFIGNFDGEQYFNQGHLGSFLTEIDDSFFGVPSARYEAACASGSVALDSAITKISSGVYDVSLVVGIELMKTVDAKTGGNFLGTAAFYDKEAKGIDFPFPKIFGHLADEIVRKYSLNESRFLDNLAEISCINYENGKKNPKAQTRNWFMGKGHACRRGDNSNILVGGKLAVSDCSQITDGAAGVVLCSSRYALEYCKYRNLEINKMPYVKGWGHRVAPVTFRRKIEESEDCSYILKWTRQAVLDAYRRASLGVDNIDLFETHDCFTSSEYAAISAFGVTEPGEEYKAIENGVIAFDGIKPINPSGGLIGCGHPVGASGVRMFLDLYKQISGKAGGYQVPSAMNALMLNIGGSATTNYVFIVGR